MSRIQRFCTLAGVVGLMVGNLLTSRAQTVIGMGTESPNPNAVLELVPENGNQGFLAPRLTSAQRTSSSFTSKLADVDNGLLVFDTDQGAFFYWYRGSWQSGVSSGQGGADPVNHGTTWFTGTTAPTAIQANEGDFYINEATGEVYKFSGSSFDVIGTVKASTGTNPSQNLSSVLQRSNSASNQKITDLGNPADPSDAATKAYVDEQVGSISLVDTDTDEQNLKDVLARGNDAEGNSISNLADPTNDQDVATKKYVDDEVDGLLPLFGTDNQNLTFNTTTKKLSIEDGNEVDLSSLDNGVTPLPSGQLFVGNASNQATPVTISGDITIAADGTVTIANASISNTMLRDNAVTTNKIANNAVVTSTVVDGAIVNAKIADDAVDRSKVNANVAGNGLAQAANGSLEVNLGGDVVTGTNTLSVVKLRGNELAAITPTDDQVLQWDAGTSQWIPADPPISGGSTVPKISIGDGKPVDGDGKVGDIYIDDEKDVYIKISNVGSDQWLKIKGKT